MSGILHPGNVTYGVIHHAKAFPVRATACGRERVPSAHEWAFVDCRACLTAAAPTVEAARVRLAAMDLAAVRREVDLREI